MKRLLCIAAIAAALAPAADEPCPIIIFVDKGPSLIVDVPNMHKAQLVSLIAKFFGKGDSVAKAKFEQLLGQSKDVTLVLTTACKPEGVKR